MGTQYVFDHDDPKFVWIPFEDVEKPSLGEEVRNCYWITHPEKGLCVYKRPPSSPNKALWPQCNPSEAITEVMANSLFSNWGAVKFYPLVYVPNSLGASHGQ